MLQVECAFVLVSSRLRCPHLPPLAQTLADFYKGKTISILMGTGPGGSYDLYGRTIAEHLGRHIPGRPNIVVEHMPGAGGVVAGNHIYGPAPQDGSRILLSHALPLVERMSPKGVQFETAKMHWLGAYDAIAQMMVLWHTVPVRTLDDLRSKEFVVGSFNKTHLSYQWAMLTKNILATNYKVTTGYPSGNHLNLAMERGEIAGWTISWENLYAVKPEWLREKKVTVFVQYTVERLRELPDVPTLAEISPPDQAADGGVHRVGHAVRARAGGRPRRAEGPRRRAAQGVRRSDAGSGIPGRREEAQARHQSAQRRGDARAA